MEQFTATFKIRGMQRDVNLSDFNSVSENSPTHIYAYENMNMRINTIDDNDQYALVNERGTLRPDVIKGLYSNIKGTPIGQNVLNNTLTLFTTESELQVPNINWNQNNIHVTSNNLTIAQSFGFNRDRIYKFWFDSQNQLNGDLLYDGNLNFKINYPIDTISYYENDDIQKVYWIDGFNQARVININANSSIRRYWNDDKFDFTRKLQLKEEVTIERTNISSGIFTPGTIQYCFTYFDKYHQESHIFYTSPIYYTSYLQRGTPADEACNNSFTINITNVDTNFDYLRIYSIQRTATNAVPTCNIVRDISINKETVTPITLGHIYTFNYNFDNLYFRLRGDNTLYSLDTLNSSIYTVLINNNNHTRSFTFSNILDAIYYGNNRIEITAGDLVDIVVDDIMHDITVNTSFLYYDPVGPHPSMTGYIEGLLSINYIDTGEYRTAIDPTELLYIGGEDLIFNTFEHKDDTLFIGNVELKRNDVGSIKSSSGSTIKEILKNHADDIVFIANKELPIWKGDTSYSYDNQLKYNSRQITTFKYLEWYRFGIQFQDIHGRWSEPLWIGDKYNDVHINTPYVNNEISTKLITAKVNISDLLSSANINRIKNKGYVKVRPVIVYPNLTDREVLCQGYLCPTVFNYEDRSTGDCYAQSSWFARPFITRPLTVKVYPANATGTAINTNAAYIEKDLIRGDHFYTPSTSSLDVTTNKYWPGIYNDSSFKGRPLEFRHQYCLAPSRSFSSEIQCIRSFQWPYVDRGWSYLEKEDYIHDYNSYYAVDQSIVTLHSPDIEFDSIISSNKLDLSKYKLRIIGMVPLTASMGHLQFNQATSGHVFSQEVLSILHLDEPLSIGAYYPNIINANNSIYGGDVQGAGAYFMEVTFASNTDDTNILSKNYFYNSISTSLFQGDGTNNSLCGFIVYPFHRNGSLTNQNVETNDGQIMCKLGTKTLSNLRYSYNTYYLNTIWNAEQAGSTVAEGLSDIQLYNYDQDQIIRLNITVDNKSKQVIYSGNINKTQFTYKPYNLCFSSVNTFHNIYNNQTVDLNAKNYIFKGWFNDYAGITGSGNNLALKHNRYSTDPVSIRYKSTPHLVLAFNATNNQQHILPRLITNTNDWDSTSTTYNSVWHDLQQYALIGNSTVTTISQDYIVDEWFTQTVAPNTPHINTPIDLGSLVRENHSINSFLWLAELYNPNIANRFGGTTEDALENNTWTIGGEAVDLTVGAELNWTEGDTYYQRYDNLKTYPYTAEEQNGIVDIISFMCETRINLDGRTDRNRGQKNNLNVTPINFNLLNTAYTQKNNYFTYEYLNSEKLNLTHFNNIISWTKTKIAGDLVDKWTHLTLANTLDFDGDKGNITVLKRHQNKLYALQEKAISGINFNENALLNTIDGVPIELSNSGKVTGKTYITNTIGCTNKWSACVSPTGLVFIDDLNKDIYIISQDGLINISEKLGFSSFINEQLPTVQSWNPVSFNNFITYYDKINHDILFINKNYCLAFNEVLNTFTSFYSYNNTPYFANIQDRGIIIHKDVVGNNYYPFLYEEGEYNNFFGVQKEYYTEFIVNDQSIYNKIFDTVEYRADAFNEQNNYVDNYTFNYLNVHNEYQENYIDLVYQIHTPSNLKKKFRTWRINIPRNRNSRDRMQNVWLSVRLGRKNNIDNNKHILYDTQVNYYI